MNARQVARDIIALERDDGTDPQALRELYTLYNENTEKLRLAFERLERRFREIDPYNIYSSITDALITLDYDHNILTVNKAASSIFDVDEQNSVGKAFGEVVTPCDPAFQQYLNDRDNEKRYDISFKMPSGDRIFLRGRFSPLLDRSGEVIGTVCLFADLSVERLLEERARRSDRLAALGELAAGVAHEMRNPLTTVRGYLQILPQNREDPEFIEEFSGNLIREIDRLTRLTENLLNMAKPISPELQSVLLSRLLDDVAIFLSDKFSQHVVSVIIEPVEDEPLVNIDRDRIKQVFINLLVNAVEAIGKDGKIAIRIFTRTEKLSEDADSRVYSVVEIQDSGPGIPDKVIDRLFDPFFTTKDHGTGLGLALSNRIVEEHQGFLRVESKTGEGACFWVMLPVFEGK